MPICVSVTVLFLASPLSIIVCLLCPVLFCLLFYFILFYFQFQVWTVYIYFLTLFVCIFIHFYKGFLNFLFKKIFHIHRGYFKVFALCFGYFALLRDFCGRIPEI